MPINTITYELTIKGHVQGVGYRNWLVNQANKYFVNGYVTNHVNRKIVIAILQGNSKDILDIYNLCKKGPTFAKVDQVIKKKIMNSKKYNIFEIK